MDRGSGAQLVAQEIVSEEDWALGWREAAEPFALGRRFWIDPGESGRDAAPAERIGLRLPARRAFGTGGHPSTRLAVAWLEEMPLQGCHVLDVGAGSGILSFVSRRLGARRVVGLELDLESVLLAGANRRLNRVETALVGGTVAALDHVSFDLIVANLLSSELEPELPALEALLGPAGRVVYSGALASERETLIQSFGRRGLRVVGEKIDGEWWSLRAERDA